MPALSRSSLLQLTGWDANIVVSELLQDTTWSTDIIFALPTGRTVVSVAGSTVTFTGGDNSIFTAGQFIAFVDDPNSYQITAIGTNTLTVVGSPLSKAVGDNISQSFPLPTGTTFKCRATEYLSSGITESRGTLDLGTISLKMPQNNQTFDSNVVVIDATKGWIRINLPANAFASDPPPLGDTPAGATYIIFAGYLEMDRPAGATPAQNPAQADSQRFVWLISSKLSI